MKAAIYQALLSATLLASKKAMIKRKIQTQYLDRFKLAKITVNCGELQYSRLPLLIISRLSSQ